MSEAPPAGFSEIGSRLRSARMAAGMSAADAAERLHCDVQVIEALESGHFEQLGASVFVRGHLRRYGDLLGQRGDALVEQWAQIEPPRVAPDLTRVPQAPRPPDTTRLWQLGALAAGVTVFAILTWWILQRPSLPPVMGPEVAVAPPAVPAAAGQTAVEALPVPVAQEERPPADVPAPVNPEPVARVVPPKVAPVSTPTAASSTKPNPANAVPQPPAARSTAPTVAAIKTPPVATARPAAAVAPAAPAPAPKAAKTPAAATGPAAATPASVPQPAASAAARLQISLSQECWVEVYDAADKRLYADLAPAGKRIALSGAAPLRVRLGREGVAQLQVNDRAVTPPTAAKRGQTALFTITADGATALVKRD